MTEFEAATRYDEQTGLFHWGGRSAPRELFELFIKSGINTYELDDALSYYKLSERYRIEPCRAEDLVGVDLKGKEFRIWLSNYDDSEWVHGSNALTVKRSGSGLELVPDEEMARFLDDDGSEDVDYDQELYFSSRVFNFNLDCDPSIELLIPLG